MEEQKSTNKQGKKKVKISIGGGGGGGSIGGVVVWGGALAVAGLIAVFATKTSRKRVSNKKPTTPSDASKEFNNSCNKEDEGTEGLRFILQTSSPSVHHSPCRTNYGTSNVGVTQIDSSELVSTQILILEGKPAPKIITGGEEKPNCDHQDILRSDDPKPEILVSCDDYGIVEDFLLQVLDKQSLIKESMNKNDCTVEPMSIETIAENKEDAASEIHEEQLAVKEKEQPMTSVEEEEEVGDECNDEDEESVVEKGQDSSEGTGDSSVEYNAEAIWPADLIEELSLELKEMKINLQNPQEKIEEDRTAKTEEYAYFNSSNNNGCEDKEAGRNSMMILNKKETEEVLKVNDQPAPSSKLRIWIWSMLVLLILLLLLSHHNTISYHLLDSSLFHEV